MDKNKKIFWISSYPKSGNTWVRLILGGLFFTKDGKIDNFNLLNKIPKFDIEKNFDFIKKLSPNDHRKIFNKKKYDEESLLTYSKYWIEAQKRKKILNGKFGFFKTHNAKVIINSNHYTNSYTTLGFIYIVRDPRDIVVSYANHMEKTLDFTIDFLLNGQIMGKEIKEKIMPEITLNWEENYLSWKKFNQVPNQFIRYEDLVNDPHKEIIKIINFFKNNFNIEIENKDKKINNIIKTTNFKDLKEKEKEIGFKEGAKNVNFFRIGKNNQWKKKLSTNQIKKIENKFSTIMTELKYSIT